MPQITSQLFCQFLFEKCVYLGTQRKEQQWERRTMHCKVKCMLKPVRGVENLLLLLLLLLLLVKAQSQLSAILFWIGSSARLQPVKAKKAQIKSRPISAANGILAPCLWIHSGRPICLLMFCKFEAVCLRNLCSEYW